jgi:hypothetical protein
MPRLASFALALAALLLSACGSNKPQALPPVDMREILPGSVAAAGAPAAPATPDTLPAVAGAGAGAGATAGLQVNPAAAPVAPPPIAPPSAPAQLEATGAGSKDFALSLSKPREPGASPDASQEFTLSLSDSKSDSKQTAAAPAETGAAPAAATPRDEAGWPRSFTATGVAFEVHEPQVQRWDGTQLVADAAVIARPEGQREAVPGIVRMTARTVVDKGAGTVAVEDLTLTDVSFPAARGQEPEWLNLLRTFAPRGVKRLSLAHLEASARQASALAQGQAAAQSVLPKVYVARNPALLVAIDGEPRFVALPGTRLQGARNTRVVLLKDPASAKLYLRVYNGWLSAASLRGPWAIADEPPGALSALQAARASGRANLLTGKPDAKTGKLPALSQNNVPRIVVATQPAILVGVSGEPKFVPIPGTTLEYVSNTKAHIFRDTGNQRVYVLAGTRWFTGTATRSIFELTPIAVDKLPADIARIPASSPKRAVAAYAKPGATAATQAQLPAVPAIVAAPRSKARFDVVINGDPELKPIAGTQLNYVANASAPIIQVDINSWYGEQSGVWFKAPDATGPWTVTDQVPPEIYSIPPNVPIYHAIHSRVFASTEDVVYYGYTPGSEQMGPTGGATGVSVEGEDYQTTPPAGLTWGWFY